MRQIRLYVDQPLATDTKVALASNAAHHVGTVLRRPNGTVVTLFNGDGNNYQATLAVEGKTILADIQSATPGNADRQSPLKLALAIIKHERMDWAIQKATELGVTNITPLITEHTVVRPSGKQADKRAERWQHISEAACEQCGRCTPPTIHNITSVADFVTELDNPASWAMLSPTVTSALTAAGLQGVIIGPEGGFSDAEITALADQGVHARSIGPRILRAETAAISALTLIGLADGQWG